MADTKNPKTFISPEDVYVDNVYVKAGHPFTTAADKNDNWTEVTPADAHIMEASLDKVPGDPPLESLGIEALRAVAVTKNVNPDGLSKAKLIDAIKAANEPAL